MVEFPIIQGWNPTLPCQTNQAASGHTQSSFQAMSYQITEYAVQFDPS